ncbi:MAG TPA: hypothetical protein PLD20_23820 [Blastocatellia bacterium]|nr:hypothetical protein [Blastocatellia bacterium]HMV87769.1 hypothetical protein [Blastocatellia bacterium]HMX28430.1 hypothetical protein [Blastocatellia bacterium]HMZ20982.1 hypothetical protein [Blastocatellia bacterium]HNG30930.1 hypothetical protein [Blastocatellia bacterium]
MQEVTLEYVESLVTKLPAQDQLALIERTAGRLKTTNTKLPERRQPQSLRGIWQGKTPEDYDVEVALQEIRQEWTKELDEFFEEK